MKYSLILIFVLAIISSAFAEEAPVQHKITFERGLFTNIYTVDGEIPMSTKSKTFFCMYPMQTQNGEPEIQYAIFHGALHLLVAFLLATEFMTVQPIDCTEHSKVDAEP